MRSGFYLLLLIAICTQTAHAGSWGDWMIKNPSDECPLYKAAEMHMSNLAGCLVECRKSLCAVFSYHADTSSCHLAGYPGVTACDGSGYVTYTTEGLATSTTTTTSTTSTSTTTTTPTPTTTTTAATTTPEGSGDLPVNLALGRTYAGTGSTTAQRSVENAFDGNTNTDNLNDTFCADRSGSKYARVNLGDGTNVTSVLFYPADDYAADITKVEIFVGDDSSDMVKPENVCIIDTNAITTIPTEYVCNSMMTGKLLAFYWQSTESESCLAEIEVY